MVKIFINDQEVRREDLSRYEVKADEAKRILAGKIKNKKEDKEYA